MITITNSIASQKNPLQPGLSIIVPTRNPGPLFCQQAERLAHEHPTWQLIVVDDHSADPLDQQLPDLPNLQVRRNHQTLGAGACRNLGMVGIARAYTLFLDDDDIMHWDVVEAAMQRMDAKPGIDLCLFLYDLLLNGANASASEHDLGILTAALRGEPERLLPRAESESLLAFTNYPWNKVYRTSFLQRAGIRFSETAVQNDILAHWQTILRAGTIYLSEQVMCTKVEYTSSDRIGNTADNRCLQAFQALRETYEMLRDQAPARVAPIFVEFYLDLYRWLNSKASNEVRIKLGQQHDCLIAAMQAENFLDTQEWAKLSWLLEIPLFEEPAKPEASILLAELSRLKRLAHSLAEENRRLGATCNQLQEQNEAMQLQVQAQQESLADLRRMAQRKLVRFALFVGDRLYRLRTGS